MIQPGRNYILEVVEEQPQYYWLAKDQQPGIERFKMPKNGEMAKFAVGDQVEVFLYTNKAGELRASPTALEMGNEELKVLLVKNTIPAGAFLKWDLPDDLFWPKSLQTHPIREGKSYPVALIVDPKGRLVASGKVYAHLQVASEYKADDEVSGVVYDNSDNWGVFVAVDNKYFGLIPKSELYQDLNYGDFVKARVMRVREDGKLDLALRKRVPLQMGEDAQYILDELLARNGFINLNDKSSPEEITERLHMSKSAFKRAVGRLMKQGYIKTSSRGIKLVKIGEEE